MLSSTKPRDGSSGKPKPAASAVPVGQAATLNAPVPASVFPPPPPNYGAVSSHTAPADAPRELGKFPGLDETKSFALAHVGLIMLIGAQFLASLQALVTRFLAISLPDGRKYHAFEVLFARMSITLIGCLAWMWWNSVEHAPFGKKEVRWLLIARGFGGLVGVYGLYSKDKNPPFVFSEWSC